MDKSVEFAIKIKRANSVPLPIIAKKYGIILNDSIKKIKCPFKSHKERTPSFVFYSKTNTYHCFGCCNGTSVCDFVCNMEGISFHKAVNSILKLFNNSNIDNDVFNYLSEDQDEKLNILLSFSNKVYEFRCKYTSDEDNDFIENVCFVFDELNVKYKDDIKNDGLSSVVEILMKEIEEYVDNHIR